MQSDTKFLDAALKYAAAGHAVFPVMGGAKKPPLTKNGLLDASKDPEVIRRWWTKYPAANIGMATGEISGVTVLDVDIKPWQGKDGKKTYDALIAEYGQLPITPWQTTWSGGAQGFYRYEPGVKNSASKIGKDLDIRGDGGYCIVPPSVVSEDGQPAAEYEWIPTFELDAIPLAPMPRWMVERLTTPDKSSATYFGWEVDLIKTGSPPGQRDADLARLVGFFVGTALSLTEIAATIDPWILRSNVAADRPTWVEDVREETLAKARRLRAKDDEKKQQEMQAEAPQEPERVVIREPWTLTTPPKSFVSRYVAEASARTDAPSEVHEALALMLLSALASDVKIPLTVPVEGMNLLLWMLYLVNSSVGRKSTTLGLAEAVIVRLLGSSGMIQWDSSPQALIEALVQRDGLSTVWNRDEVAPLVMQVKRYGGHLAALPGYLCRAYDGQPLENKRTAKNGKSDSPRAERPYLALWWAGTYDAVLDHLTIDDVLSGFLPRFAIITASDVEPRPLGKVTPEMKTAREAIVQAATEFQFKTMALTDLDPSPDALTAWSEIEMQWATLAGEQENVGAARALLKRSSDMILKVAALLAIDLTPTPAGARLKDASLSVTITADHVRMAETIVRRWRDSGLRTLADLGRSRYQKDVDGVLATVEAKGSAGLPLRDVYRIHRRINGRYMKDILAHLEAMERVTLFDGEKTGTRAVKMIRGRRG